MLEKIGRNLLPGAIFNVLFAHLHSTFYRRLEMQITCSIFNYCKFARDFEPLLANASAHEKTLMHVSSCPPIGILTTPVRASFMMQQRLREANQPVTSMIGVS